MILPQNKIFIISLKKENIFDVVATLIDFATPNFAIL